MTDLFVNTEINELLEQLVEARSSGYYNRVKQLQKQIDEIRKEHAKASRKARKQIP